MKRLQALLVGCLVAAGLVVLMTGCTSSESYAPPEKTPMVSAPAIIQDGVLKVGVDATAAPLAGQPANSTKIVGIDVDIAAALADQLGLKLEVIDVGSDPEAALEEGRVDIVMGVDGSDDSYTFWRSESYLPTAVALFATTQGQAPAADTTASIAAQLSSKSAWAAANIYKSASLTTTDTLESAFSSLATGKVDYVASDMVIGTYAAHSAGQEVQAVALLQPASGYCIGVLDANTELKQCVSDALATLSGSGVVSVIESKWLGQALDLTNIPVAEGATSVSTDDEDAEQSADGEEAADGSAVDPAVEEALGSGSGADEPSATDGISGTDGTQTEGVSGVASNAVVL
ncbi:substrate-binding periplasmic protein [Adlercreutzia sp. ZJ141]|uniref:substrate-binding periplasmic protein n=1 Tax=Adlercreutzia sp. ZJ141 TaxID=2709406 RepID=UPI0013EC9A0A|nr:transporter substrate-binding domain-containing protein [Adlercreutzia sp. ZJ141]